MKPRGFTLIELLVVISIIALLSSVVLSALQSAKNQANDSKRVSDVGIIRTALEMYYNTYNTYPNPGAGWRSQCVAWGNLAANNVIPGLVPNFLPAMPVDPNMDTANNLCCYLYYSTGTDYKFLAHNCPGYSTKCYGAGEASGPYPDPARPTWSCAVYTPGASGW